MSSLELYYYLAPMHVNSSYHVLEVLGGRIHDRAKLGLGYLKPNAAHQLWAFHQRYNGYYEIINKHSKLVLDDSRNNCDPGGEVYQFGRHDGDNQLWRIKRAKEHNCIHILAKVSGFALDVGDWSQNNHAKINLWPKGNNQANQIWHLIPASR